jgi:iron-sulfur cluster assembly protein
MLTLTPEAISLLNQLERSVTTVEGVGLRIATDQRGMMNVQLVEAPSEGDSTIARSGALVFLDQDAAVVLADKTLDAHQTADGQIQFTITEGEEV